MFTQQLVFLVDFSEFEQDIVLIREKLVPCVDHDQVDVDHINDHLVVLEQHSSEIGIELVQEMEDVQWEGCEETQEYDGQEVRHEFLTLDED
jgi:hypothetical protein